MELTHVFSMDSGPWPAQPGWSPVSGHWIEEPVPVQDSAIGYVRQGPQAGSFTVRGVAEYNQGRYRLAQVLAALRAVDPGAGTEAAEYLAYLAMYGIAENLRAICVVFIRALLGDPLARSVLADRTTSVGPEIEQEAYAAVLRLVDAVPGSFHVSGPLAQALGIDPRRP
jgi:hypothetical protein